MNVYLLTEEKPKISTVKSIVQVYQNDFGKMVTFDQNIEIVPEVVRGRFRYDYVVNGIHIEGINNVIIETVSGASSFLDYLFYVSEKSPKDCSESPVFAVEETKTSDDESRNTGVYQRCSKFVFIKAYYPDIPLYMLYNDELELRVSKEPSDTSKFGTDMLLTNDVKIVGKPIEKWFHRFASYRDVIRFKNAMRRPPAGNTPILMQEFPDKITISGRLDKPQNIGKIAHDPNIGGFSIMAQTLRKLGWEKDIVITRHNVQQSYVTHTKGKNKFLFICKLLNIKLDGIKMPANVELPEDYWHYERSSEKVASIFLHLAAELGGCHEVYQNHAGCERGYFKDLAGNLVTLPKRVGSPERNLLIPDLVFRDDAHKIVYLIEGKKLSTLAAGLEEVEDYDDIESMYIKPSFRGYEVRRYVSIYGGNLTTLPNRKVLLYINEAGDVIVNKDDENIVSLFNKTLGSGNFYKK